MPNPECPHGLVFGSGYRSSPICLGCIQREQCGQAYEADCDARKQRDRYDKYRLVTRPYNVCSHLILGFEKDGSPMRVLLIPKNVQSVRLRTCHIRSHDPNVRLRAYLEIKSKSDNQDDDICIYVEDMDTGEMNMNLLSKAIEMQNYVENTISIYGDSIEMPLKSMAWGREIED